eukprot:PhM_4_TR18929/c0_g1_i1/m.30311
MMAHSVGQLSVFLIVVLSALVGAEPVYYGQSAALSGPRAALTVRYNTGLMTALAYTNSQGGVFGRTMHLRVLDDGGDPNRAAANTRTLLSMADTVGLVGYLSDATVRASLPIARAANVPLLAPMSGSMEFRLSNNYHPYLLHMRVSHNDEAVGMLRMMLTELQYKRWCVVVESGTFDRQKDVVIGEMTSVGLMTSCVHTYNASATATDDFGSVLTRISSVDAQGVVLLASSEWSALFFDLYYTSNNNSTTTRKPAFITGSWAAEALRTHFQTRGYPPTDLIMTQVTPLPTSKAWYVSRLFQGVMTAVHGPSVVLDHPSFEGFLTGRFLFEVLKRMYTADRQTLFNVIYGTGLFQILDVFAGPYANSRCGFANAVAERRGRASTCNCSTGMRIVDFLTMDKSYKYAQRAKTMNFEILLCEAIPVTQAPTPLAMGTPAPSMKLHVNMSNFFVGLSSEDSVEDRGSWATVPVVMFPLRVTSNTSLVSSQAIHDKTKDTFLLATMGLASTETQSLVPVFSGMTQQSLHEDQLHRTFEREKLFLFPTFPQEVHSAMALAHELRVRSVTVAYRHGVAATAEELQFMVSESLRTFFDNAVNVDVSFVPFNTVSEVVSGNVFPQSTVPDASMRLVFVVGIASPSDLKQIADTLVQSPVNAVVLFSEAAAAWEGLRNCTTATHGTALRRLRLTSNVPLWTAPGSSTFSTQYRYDMRKLDDAVRRHPMTVMGYVTARLLRSLLLRSSSGDGAKLLDAAYQFGTFIIADFAIGSFDDAAKCNVGVRRMHHYHAAAVLFDDKDEAEKLPVVSFTSCGVSYAPAPSSSSVSVGLVVALVVVGIAIGVGVITMIMLNLSGRSARNVHAPRESPMCLLSTDIQSSTKLWEHFPADMPKAVEMHHGIIRRLIKEYDAYEVKTVGDAFIIAVASTLDGTLLALDIQEELHDAEWPSGLDVNVVYVGCDTNPDVWNGLRVRVGVHHATDVTVVYDTVRGRYDYSGGDVMTLKKVESAADGGQVLMNADTYEVLSQQPEFATLLEPVITRRRVKHDSLVLYNLLPMDLAGRFFAGETVLDTDSLQRADELASSIGSTVRNGLGASRTHLATRVFVDAWPKEHNDKLLSLYCAALSVPEQLPRRRRLAIVMNALDQRVVSVVTAFGSAGKGTNSVQSMSMSGSASLSLKPIGSGGGSLQRTPKAGEKYEVQVFN